MALDADTDYFQELMRIAQTLENEDDAMILRAAAFFSRKPEPKEQKLTAINGYGYLLESTY